MTAPHGPSEAVIAAEDALYRALAESVRGDTTRGGPWTDLILNLKAEVRAAVVAECADLVGAYWQEIERDDCYVGEPYEKGRLDALDVAEQRLRALLPPVSAPGPTLPPLPDGWTVEVRYQDRQSEPAGPLWIATNPDGERIRYSVGVWMCGLIICGSQDTASESRAPEAMAHLFALRSAHLASRAERGPGDAHD